VTDAPEDPHEPAPSDRAPVRRGVGGWMRWAWRLVRRGAVGVVGAAVLLVGGIMLVAPGPALVVIPIGLGILALEFAWAGRLLQRFRAWAGQAHDRYTRRRGR